MASDSWPADGLEAVANCPYCGGTERSLAHGGVEDGAFACAQVPSFSLEMAIESERMARRSATVSAQDRVAAKACLRESAAFSAQQDDVVQLVCTRGVS